MLGALVRLVEDGLDCLGGDGAGVVPVCTDNTPARAIESDANVGSDGRGSQRVLHGHIHLGGIDDIHSAARYVCAGPDRVELAVLSLARDDTDDCVGILAAARKVWAHLCVRVRVNRMRESVRQAIRL